MQLSILIRNLKHKAEQGKDIAVQSGMQYKICRDTYHMFYIIGTEDAFVRHGTKKPTVASNNRSTQWKAWVDAHWTNGVSDKSAAEAEALALLQ